jgi:hypothetical protein
MLLLITEEEDIKLINGVNTFFNEQMCQNEMKIPTVIRHYNNLLCKNERR